MLATAAPSLDGLKTVGSNTACWAVLQGMEAATKLQRNMAAEKAAMSDLSHVFGAVITPHQGVCGDLAAWPQTVYITRLVAYLGVRLKLCRNLCPAHGRKLLLLRS